MINDHGGAYSSVVGQLLFASLIHLFCLNYNQPFYLYIWYLWAPNEPKNRETCPKMLKRKITILSLFWYLLTWKQLKNPNIKKDPCAKMYKKKKISLWAFPDTCWSIPRTVGVFQRITVRLHFRRRNASKVRLWSLLVPGIPLTRVIYKFGLHSIGTQALKALKAFISALFPLLFPRDTKSTER